MSRVDQTKLLTDTDESKQLFDPEEESELLDNLEEQLAQAKHDTKQPAVPPRRSERERTLTEKGKELHSAKTKELLHRFDRSYEY